MTKHIRYALILAVLLFTLLPASAVRYRGFVDAAPGRWVIGCIPGLKSREEYPIYLNTTHGIQFNNLFYAGVGAGMRFKQFNSYPQAFADFRFDFNSYRNNHPYMDFKLGLLYLYSDDHDEPPFASIGGGYRIKLNNHIGMNIGLGLTTDYGEWRNGGNDEEGVALSINLGIDF